MPGRSIKYEKRRKYKYTLLEPFSMQLDIFVPVGGCWGLLAIDRSGLLEIRRGYAWDGPSGPTFDTPAFMRGSLVHDALYQLMREGRIPRTQRKRADEILRAICLEDGMSRVRAQWVYLGVRMGARKAAESALLTAPE